MKTVKMVIFDDAEREVFRKLPAGWQQTLLGEIVTEQELLSVYHGLRREIAARYATVQSMRHPSPESKEALVAPAVTSAKVILEQKEEIKNLEAAKNIVDAALIA